MEISNELLAAYAEGNVSPDERKAVRQYLTENPSELESVMMMMDEDYDLTIGKESATCDPLSSSNDSFDSLLTSFIDELGLNSTRGDIAVLPMTAMAAEDKMNSLCVIRCEGEALRHFGFAVNDDDLIEESLSNGWLQDEGTALHNIGRLSGARGLSVAHRYNCSFNDIANELANGRFVIAVVDSGELTGDLEEEQHEDETLGNSPDHAVIVTQLTDGQISIQDPSSLQKTDNYPLPQFANAWADSSNYLIVISSHDDYEPHPIDLSDVEISDDLIELREAIAENAHEVWAANRKREGWTYGPVRDDANKQHPDMIAYNLLPDSEKVYDREMAINTIKLVKKLGYDIIKH